MESEVHLKFQNKFLFLSDFLFLKNSYLENQNICKSSYLY